MSALGTRRAWAELLRLPALFTVPGDALAGAAATGLRPNHRTLLAIGSSLCLYEAGMALNDWADRAEDAVERPERPLPSGRIAPPAALTAATALTAAGLALASRAGRPALAVAGTLAGTVWAYDLVLKHTPAGPAAMATARGLDLLLGATATAGPDHTPRARATAAAPSAAALAAHTLAVTVVSRREAQGGSSTAPLAALATTAALTTRLIGAARRSCPGGGGTWRGRGAPPATMRPGGGAPDLRNAVDTARRALPGALALAYAATAAKPLFHAALNPSPPLTQRAVGGGIRAMIPLQAALAARTGAPATALLTAALAPAARRFARKVSVT
ncbi:prenyltransferase [Streptomyces venezuelae]|uniref:Prenyltransferase n=1 Tax=Streptomyces venezuelae TaxID=54571 RepID=A0A5P2CPM9_STRVZ|nr:UbiA family prenyltransferase [Streptomyces venezuelae]QES44864.1 prenyltransferase [Streptomyces venezuelae]